MITEPVKTDWTSTKAQLKTKFDKFNDTELEGLNGHMDQLSDKVQKMYGYSKERADQECRDFNKTPEQKTV